MKPWAVFASYLLLVLVGAVFLAAAAHGCAKAAKVSRPSTFQEWQTR